MDAYEKHHDPREYAPKKKKGNPGHHYPRRRKSPIKHIVSTHMREGTRINSFLRGKGARIQSASNSRRSQIRRAHQTARMGKYEEFKITFDYGKGRKEQVTVQAHDMDDAMNLALKRRKSKLKPINAVIKDGIGEWLGKISGKVVGQIRIGREKYKLETARARETQLKIGAMNLAERERFVKRKIHQAKLGDREAQILLENYNVAWESV